jgi:hypothetical protein
VAASFVETGACGTIRSFLRLAFTSLRLACLRWDLTVGTQSSFSGAFFLAGI